MHSLTYHQLPLASTIGSAHPQILTDIDRPTIGRSPRNSHAPAMLAECTIELLRI